ncbi:DNA cytosine methyltransferase [Porphyromonadaceae bacterium W3.11]|nr:DNA cytosine methyltransferase [Porphyromonadaceae bacterium W3.11]
MSNTINNDFYSVSIDGKIAQYLDSYKIHRDIEEKIVIPEDVISKDGAVLTHTYPLSTIQSTCLSQNSEVFESTGIIHDGDYPATINRATQIPSLPFFRSFDLIPFPPPLKTRFTFIDLFAGIGGFRLGMQRHGGECLYSSEWDRGARQVYFANYGEVPFGDITLKSTKSYIPEKFDLLSAGFPCQPFSISGKMKGFEDTRGTLIYDVFEIIDHYRPKVVMLENVKHLRYHDKGQTLKVILHSLREMGYYTEWCVLNASNFGVPQNRERIIIMATLKRPFIWDKLKKVNNKSVILRDILETNSEERFEYLDEPYTLIDQSDVTVQKSGLIFVGYLNKKIRGNGVRPGTNHLSRVHKQPNRIYSSQGVHPAIPSQETSGRFWILDEGKVRKLTVLECYRLMGFPDNFIKSSSISEQYRQIGNSVAVPMVEAIIKELQEQDFI